MCFASGKTTYYYKCARDGCKREHGPKKPRKTDRQRYRDTRKSGMTCPAHIVAVSQLDNTVKVQYFSLHIGHGSVKEQELKHQSLPQSTRHEIKAKLELGVKPDRILSGTEEYDGNFPVKSFQSVVIHGTNSSLNIVFTFLLLELDLLEFTLKISWY